DGLRYFGRRRDIDGKDSDSADALGNEIACGRADIADGDGIVTRVDEKPRNHPADFAGPEQQHTVHDASADLHCKHTLSGARVRLKADTTDFDTPAADSSRAASLPCRLWSVLHTRTPET